MAEFPATPEEVLELPIDELAIRLLSKLATPNSGLLNRTSFGDGSFISAHLQIDASNSIVQNTLLEAYDWLMFHGLIAFVPTQYGGWARITRPGKSLLDDPNPLQSIRAAYRIGLDLHPLISRRIRRQFLLGEYESAVFLAFREVEIRVRELGGFPDSATGVRLMRDAFKKEGGKLTDPALDDGEKVATMELFAGAIGAFKNPSSHRQVDYGEITVAAEAVMLADLLLRMLDRYSPATE